MLFSCGLLVRNSVRYASQSVRYASQSMRYASQSVRYASQSMRYAPPLVRYASQSMRYASQSVRYASQSVRYSSQSVRYASQSVRYASQSVRYSSQSMRYASQPDRYASQSVRYSSQSKRYAPPLVRYAPQWARNSHPGGAALICHRNLSGEEMGTGQGVLDTRRDIAVLDSRMSYLDTGGKDCDKTVVFIHGNPTSSFLWRKVIEEVQPMARCLAPDLIGMGRSGKLAGSLYRFADHYKYFSSWMDSVQLPGRVTIVGHDWGTALGLHWCNLNRERAQAVVFMEGFVQPFPDWEVLSESAQNLFKSLRSEAGDDLVLDKNFFVERMLPYQVMHTLSKAEMDEYKRPYLEAGESRRPTLTWIREIPFGRDGPPEVIDLMDSYSAWLGGSTYLPKLFVEAEPGFFSQAMKEAVRNWPNIQIAYVKGFHYMQEDSGRAIGRSIADFLRGV